MSKDLSHIHIHTPFFLERRRTDEFTITGNSWSGQTVSEAQGGWVGAEPNETPGVKQSWRSIEGVGEGVTSKLPHLTPKNCALRLGTPGVSPCFLPFFFFFSPQRYEMHSTIFFSVNTLHCDSIFFFHPFHRNTLLHTLHVKDSWNKMRKINIVAVKCTSSSPTLTIAGVNI